MVLAALFILLAAVFVWGFSGSLPTTIQSEGVASNGYVWCYINMDDAEKTDVGHQAILTQSNGLEMQGHVSEVMDIPMSTAEIASELKSDYLVQSLADEEFAVKTIIAVDNFVIADGTLLDVSIVTDSIRPIDFLLE
jgi:hypothetical protein